jgi:ribulose-phosphate 3-epimerase
VVSELADYVDIVLCMTVNPGWGGQKFIPESPDKVTRLSRFLKVADAGASLFVAGSAVFGSDDPAAAYTAIAEAAGAA